jgi:hypothetical protein
MPVRFISGKKKRRLKKASINYWFISGKKKEA